MTLIGKRIPSEHYSTDSRESIELDDYSDDEDEVFLSQEKNGQSKDSAKKPLMKKKVGKK